VNVSDIFVRVRSNYVIDLTMDMISDNAEGAARAKDNAMENGQLNVQMVAEIAAEAHRTEASEDDVLHDLRDSFARTASLSKRPTVRRKNSGQGGGGRPMAPRRAQSMHAGNSTELSTMPTLLNQGNSRSFLQRPGGPSRTNSSGRPGVPSRTNSNSGLQRSLPPRTSSSSGLPKRSQSSKGGFIRGTPVRTASDSLRTMQKGQIVNTALERKENSVDLLRGHDDKSVATFSDLDSCFTMDSVTMRKHQLIADPLEDNTYREDDSYADHDDSISHWSEHMPELQITIGGGESSSQMGGESIATFCTLDSLRLRRLQIHDVLDQACDISFFSGNSFSTLNTADLDLDLESVMDEEGLYELKEAGESALFDLGGSECELNASQASVACVSVDANVV
jgi:hypothetical protein